MEKENFHYRNARALAELLEIKNFVLRDSCYNGIEICWLENPTDEKYRVITFVQGGNDFAYTKDISGLPGNWIKQDYYFLYI